MKQSAGILLYRKVKNNIEVLLVHPGGPFWKNKDDGAWSIPKGEFAENENALDAARREFFEETGITVKGETISLSPARMKSGKIVFAWAVEQDIDADAIRSNLFEMEWPPKSGKQQAFPEVDRAEWFTPERAIVKINAAQVCFIHEVTALQSNQTTI